MISPLYQRDELGDSIKINTVFGNTLVKIDPNTPTLIKVTSALAAEALRMDFHHSFGDHTQKIGEGDQVLTIEANVVFGKIDFIEK